MRIGCLPGGAGPHSVSLKAGGRQFCVDPQGLAAGWPMQHAQVAAHCVEGLAVPATELARWGHFGHPALPWERIRGDG